MIDIKKKSECCGCYACTNICPKQCIEMKFDNEGFWYPEVDKDKCIDCSLCEKTRSSRADSGVNPVNLHY